MGRNVEMGMPHKPPSSLDTSRATGNIENVQQLTEE
jgi:hypothetical protein